jgi:hypothetical protein
LFVVEDLIGLSHGVFLVRLVSGHCLAPVEIVKALGKRRGRPLSSFFGFVIVALVRFSVERASLSFLT